MSERVLHLIVPGPLDQRTGGYLYDARVADGLRRCGWRVVVHSLEGGFPGPDPAAATSLDRVLAGLPDGSLAVIDGLALGAHPGPARTHGDRLRILALVHHPLCEETGLGPRRRARLADLERRALDACTGTVVTSGFTGSRLEDLGVAPDRIRTVRPGTGRAPAAPGPRPGEPPRLLCVGSVIPRKGHDVLVRALRRLRELDWNCVCAGSLDRDPGHARSVRRRVRECGLSRRIRFTGECARTTLEELYASSSLFVLASHYEGYGMALTEALARGLPVVATAGGAIPDTVPRDAGRLVPPADPGALARALAGLLGERGEGRRTGGGGSPSAAERRDRLGAAGRRYARSLPDWPETAEAFGRAVLELAPGRATA